MELTQEETENLNRPIPSKEIEVVIKTCSTETTTKQTKPRTR